jgi:YHS domain-containing protein
MEQFISLLLIIGFYFLMMRFGCGAHAGHEHRKKHHDNYRGPEHGTTHNVDQGSQTNKGGDVCHVDPVCGMQVPMYEGYGKMHKGELYRFCSRDCLDRFEIDTARFVREADVHA